MGSGNPDRGDLVRWYCRNPANTELYLGLVLTANARQRMSDVWWPDYITTSDWEDLEVINESSII